MASRSSQSGHDRCRYATDVAGHHRLGAYLAAPSELPPDHAAHDDLPRAVADYVAGMTDRFAAREHLRLTGRPAFDTEAA